MTHQQNQQPIKVIPHMSDNRTPEDTRTPAQADADTISLLFEVEALRRQLRILEPQLSKEVTDYGLRRGYRGYREFYLRNDLNQQQYVEK